MKTIKHKFVFNTILPKKCKWEKIKTLEKYVKIFFQFLALKNNTQEYTGICLLRIYLNMCEFLLVEVYLVVEYKCKCMLCSTSVPTLSFPTRLYKFLCLPVEYESSYCFTVLPILDNTNIINLRVVSLLVVFFFHMNL